MKYVEVTASNVKELLGATKYGDPAKKPSVVMKLTRIPHKNNLTNKNIYRAREMYEKSREGKKLRKEIDTTLENEREKAEIRIEKLKKKGEKDKIKEVRQKVKEKEKKLKTEFDKAALKYFDAHNNGRK